MEELIKREEVDKEHIIQFQDKNVTLFFLKASDKETIKYVESLLIDSFEERLCA